MTPRSMQARLLLDPPVDASLAIVHSVDPSLGLAGVAYVHSPLPLDQLEHITTIVVGKLQLPTGLLAAEGLASPYLQLFCMTSEATGSSVIKSRRNLARLSQGGSTVV